MRIRNENAPRKEASILLTPSGSAFDMFNHMSYGVSTTLQVVQGFPYSLHTPLDFTTLMRRLNHKVNEVHYYQFNIADYRKDTGHLTLLEHGIYRSLLDTYYLNEKPLCADDALLMRTHCIRTEDEKEAFKNILKDFFFLTKKGYKHKKCDEQIAKYNAKSDKARLSAKARWDANALRTQSEGNANHKPITNNHKPKDQNTLVETKVSTCPIQQIIDLYHKELPELPKVLKRTKTRDGYIKQRWREDLPTLENWENFFSHVKQSKFLMGKTTGSNGKPPFIANLEWLTKPTNFAKIAEGNYVR